LKMSFRSRAVDHKVEDWAHDVYTTMASSKSPHHALAIVWGLLRDRQARSATLVTMNADGFTIDYTSPAAKVSELGPDGGLNI